MIIIYVIIESYDNPPDLWRFLLTKVELEAHTCFLKS